MKRKVLIFPLLLIMSSCSNGKSSSSSPEVKIDTSTFDENSIILTAPVISDMHVGYSDLNVNNKERFDYTLKYFNTLRSSYDAVLSCGDHTQGGLKEQVDDLMEVYNDNLNIDETPFVFAHGNHDTYWSGCMSTTEFYNAYGEKVYQYDLDHTQAKLGNRHVVINNIHVFALQIKTFIPKYNDLTDETFEWADAEIKKACESNPNMPVFVLCHSPAWKTVYGSYEDESTGTWGASKQLNDLLGKYPQVFLLSGHTHYGITDNRCISQTTYTQYQCGSTCDLDLDEYNTKFNIKDLSNERSYGFGSILEVDKYGNSRITRYDLMKKEMIKSPLYISHPDENGEFLKKYNFDEIRKTKTAPSLGSSGKYILTYDENEHFYIEINNIEESDMIFGTLVRVYAGDEIDEDMLIAEFGQANDYYNYPTPNKDLSFSINGKYSKKNKWTVSIQLVDSYGLTSEEYLPTEKIN